MADEERVSKEALGTVIIARMLAAERAPANVVAAVTTTDKTDVHWLTADDVVSWGGVMLDKDGTPQGQAETVAKAARPTQIGAPSGLY